MKAVNVSLFFAIALIVSILNSCTSDLYQNVPDEVDGLGFLRLDTGSSLKSTFSVDTLDRRDSFSTCFSFEKSLINGFDSSLIVAYRGVQFWNKNRRLFLHIKGIKSMLIMDSVTFKAKSTLGEAIVHFDSNKNPGLSSFDFNKREAFPDSDPCFTQKDKLIFGRSKIYIECPSVETNQVLYGWERSKLRKPKCHL